MKKLVETICLDTENLKKQIRESDISYLHMTRWYKFDYMDNDRYESSEDFQGDEDLSFRPCALDQQERKAASDVSWCSADMKHDMTRVRQPDWWMLFDCIKLGYPLHLLVQMVRVMYFWSRVPGWLVASWDGLFA